MKPKPFLAPLLAVLLSATAAPAGDTNPPAVDKAKLDAFMEKWKISSPLEEGPQAAADRPLLLAAFAQDPTGPWAGYIDRLAANARFHIRQLKWEERQAWAARLLDTLLEAERLRRRMQATGVSVASPRQAFVQERGFYPETKAFLALEAGRDLDRIKQRAREQLAAVQAPGHWYDGDTIYAANTTLGRVALRQGDWNAAREFLRAAGRVTGSPALNSFGPDFLLANELLAHGTAADREAVLAFLDDVAVFWANPEKIRAKSPGDSLGLRLADEHLKTLDGWRATIRSNQIPADVKWR